MSARSRPWLPVLALLWCSACPVLGREEEAFTGPPEASSDRVPVVDDEGPFDPSEAVDDDDGSVVVDDADDPTDGPAFASPAERGGAETAENERTEGEDGLGKEEDRVQSPAEVEAREGARAEEVADAAEDAERQGGEEDERKAEASTNPPPEPAHESEPTRGKVADVALEAVIVAAAAALLTAAIVFATSHPRIVTIGGIVTAAIAWFVWSQRA